MSFFCFWKYSGCLPTSEDARVQSVSNLSYLETFKTKNIVNSFSPIFSFWHTMCAIFYCFQICIKSCAKAPVSFTRLNETPIRHACFKTTTKRSIVLKMTSERCDRSLSWFDKEKTVWARNCLQAIEVWSTFSENLYVCHWGMRTINKVPWSRKLAFSASPPMQGELETVDMIAKRFPQHLKRLFSVRFSHWLDSLLDDQPDWLQVIDSCL